MRNFCLRRSLLSGRASWQRRHWFGLLPLGVTMRDMTMRGCAPRAYSGKSLVKSSQRATEPICTSSFTAFLAHARFSSLMWLPLQSYCAGQMPFKRGSSSPVVRTSRRWGSLVCSRHTRKHSGRHSRPDTFWLTCALTDGVSSVSRRSGSNSRSQLVSYASLMEEVGGGAREEGEEGGCEEDETVFLAGPVIGGINVHEWPARATPPGSSQGLVAAPPPPPPLPPLPLYFADFALLPLWFRDCLPPWNTTMAPACLSSSSSSPSL